MTYKNYIIFYGVTLYMPYKYNFLFKKEEKEDFQGLEIFILVYGICC